MTEMKVFTLTTLILLPWAITAQEEDLCTGMTLSQCTIAEDNIIHRYPYPAAICEVQCKKSDNCGFWRVYQNSSMEGPECIHFGTDYQQVDLIC